MSKLGELWRRLGMLLRREDAARELDEEMRLHREMKERELMAGGVEKDEARYAARRAFGNGDGAERARTRGLGLEVAGRFRAGLAVWSADFAEEFGICGRRRF